MGWWRGRRHPAGEAFTSAPAVDDQGRPVRVTLLGRQGCHLCEEVREVVRGVCEEAGAGWVEADLDAVPALLPAYATKVPVVFVDDRELAVWRLEPDRLRRALAGGRDRLT